MTRPRVAPAVAGAAAATALFGLGCGDDTRPAPAPAAPLVVETVPSGYPAGTPVTLAPEDNLLTEARAVLGRRLFFEPLLSRTQTVACATCHAPERAFSDATAVSTGVDGRSGTRNAPALVNLAWGRTFFWDGRAATLEEQAGKPIEDSNEMDLPLPEAATRLADSPTYARAFDEAYGGPPTPDTVRKALASFVRVLVSADSPYDRHLRGDDSAFGESERRGEAIFGSQRGGCFHCHPAGKLTNEGFFNNGTYVAGGDPGRQKVTGRTGDLGKFKVPGLRNVAVTGPYMHDGSLATLEDVIDHYSRGGNGNPGTDPTIEPFELSPDERGDLAAFLRALTDAAFLNDTRFRDPAAR